MNVIAAIPGKPIPLGRLGENERTTVVFDVSDWLEEYPDATIGLMNRLPEAGDSYPAIITPPADGKVAWIVTSAELSVIGDGECELMATQGTVVVKGEYWRTVIYKSMDGDGETPDVWESWKTEFNRIKGEAEAAAADATGAVAHYPYIDAATGHWMVWDAAAGAFADTGIEGRGQRGMIGPQGPKGDTGTGTAGPQGIQGPQGIAGADGGNGVVVDVGADAYAFRIDQDGHLMLDYEGETEPRFEIDSRGHLIRYIGDDNSIDLGYVVGPQGERGPTGETGAKGDKGDPGERGETGPRGLMGPAGQKGDRGDPGERGPQGPKGDTGARGSMGPAGQDGKDGKDADPAELIDDETPAADKTYSSEKIDEELSDVMNAIKSDEDKIFEETYDTQKEDVLFTSGTGKVPQNKIITVDIPTGDKYSIIFSDPRGCIKANVSVSLYEMDSGGNTGSSIKAIKAGTLYDILATKDVKGLSIYVGSTDVINTGTVTFTVYTNYQENADALEAKVKDLEENSVSESYNGLVGIGATWSNGYWANNAFNSDSDYRHSNYIPINEIAIPIHYKIKAISTVPSYVLFNADYGYIGKHNISQSSLTVVDDTVDDFEGAAYIVFETYRDYTPIIEYSDLPDAKVVGYLKEITINDIPNKLITQDKLSFADFVLPTNLFNYKNPDYCIRGYWYYSTTVGSVVSAVQNANTTPYVAIKIPLFDDIEKVTFGIYPNVLTRIVYWVGAVDADMKLINYQIVNTQPPITYTIPSGAKYLLVSYSLDAANFDAYIPTIMAVSGETITGYSEYHDPYYVLENCKTEIEDEHEDSKVKLMLPESYDAVVGDTIQIFYKGIVNATNPELYDIKVQCNNGSAYTRYFEFTPNAAGNVNATFNLYDPNHNLIDTKLVTFKVKAKASSPATQKNILCVGDSLTTGGVWPVELYRRLTGTGGTPAGDGLTNINFIGTRAASGVRFEGYGGWTFNSYNTANVSTNAKIITCSHDKTEALDQHSIYKDGNNDTWKLETIESGSIKIIAVSSEGRNFPSTGTLTWVSGGTNHSNIIYTASANAPGNPFWNASSNNVNFATYAAEQGASSIDYVLVLMGWNSASLTEEAYKEQAQTFITNVHASFPNAKIVLLGLEIPARDGLATNYGATGIYSDYYGLMQYVFNIDSWYADLAGNNTNVYAVNLSGQFDTEYNMPTGTRQVNTRNTETITYQSNGVHPATQGYYQIADAFYRWLMGVL